MMLRERFANLLVRAAKRAMPPGRPIAIPPHLLLPQQPSAPTGLLPDKLQLQMQTAQGPQPEITTAFPPGSPLMPAPGAVSPRGPRQYNYPVGYNVAQLPRGTEGTSYATLRGLAASYEGIRMCERVWFDVLSRLHVKVGFLPGTIPDGESEQDAKWRKVAAPAEAFFAKPDGRLPMSQWLVASAKDVLELGLSIIYLNRNRAGDIISLDLVDSSTIKPIIDERGRQPQPPYPAYQQFVYGTPGGQYTADEMIDITEMSRTDSAYPTSRVEDILVRVNLALRKGTLDLTRFTDGAVPEGMLKLVAGAQMTGEQLEEYEQRLNGQLGGNDPLKVRLKILPPDVEEFIAARQSDPNLDLDRFLLNICCGEFGVTMDEIAMTETSNRSVGESQQNVTYRRVVQPLGTRYTDFFTIIAQLTFDPRLCVSWSGMEEAEDRLAKAQELDIGVKNGGISPSFYAHSMGYPVEQEIPNYVIAQGGPEGIVLMDTLDAIRENNLQTMQAKLQQAQATAQNSAEQGKMLEQSLQQSQGAGEENFGEEFGGEEEAAGAGEGNAKPEAAVRPEEGEEETGEEGAESAVDDLIAQAKQGKGPKRAQDGTPDPRLIADEWKRYRRRALRAIDVGTPIPPFTSEILPAGPHEWVAEQLQRAQTADAVRNAFAQVREVETHPVECRCLICGCGSPSDDHGMPYAVLPPNTEPDTTCWVSFFLPASVSQQLAIPGGCAAQDLHITLAFLGDTTDATFDKQHLLSTVERFARSQHPLWIDIDALDRFPGDEEHGSPIIARTYTPAIYDFRAALVNTLDAAGIAVDMTYPEYKPHCTLAYIPVDAPMPAIPVPNLHPCLSFLWVAWGDERYSFPLGGDDKSTERAEMAETLRALRAQVTGALAAEY